MQEVTIRLRFTRECLGYARKPLRRRRDVMYCMPRDGQGRVQFLPSWWREIMRFAAKVVGRHLRDVDEIAWAGPVDGMLHTWRRVVVPAKEGRRARYALHEAFRPGTVIRVNAVLPRALGIDEFVRLLEVAGTYRGVSPFRADGDTYGTFEVVSVLPAIRSGGHGSEEDS